MAKMSAVITGFLLTLAVYLLFGNYEFWGLLIVGCSNYRILANISCLFIIWKLWILGSFNRGIHCRLYSSRRNTWWNVECSTCRSIRNNCGINFIHNTCHYRWNRINGSSWRAYRIYRLRNLKFIHNYLQYYQIYDSYGNNRCCRWSFK